MCSYARNYFRQMSTQEEDGETAVKLPVRWMALESLNDGIFSEKTDVVRTPIPFLGAHYNRLSAVVIWSDMLGGVLIGEEPLPWSGPLFSHQISGEWRETGQTSQCCLLTGYVSLSFQGCGFEQLVVLTSYDGLALDGDESHYSCYWPVREVYSYALI